MIAPFLQSESKLRLTSPCHCQKAEGLLLSGNKALSGMGNGAGAVKQNTSSAVVCSRHKNKSNRK